MSSYLLKSIKSDLQCYMSDYTIVSNFLCVCVRKATKQPHNYLQCKATIPPLFTVINELTQTQAG